MPKSVLLMNSTHARQYFLKPESYCNIDLPTYIQFKTLLSKVTTALKGKQLASLSDPKKMRQSESVNYRMLSNKDGRHAWRPFELIHPALYVSLVEAVTQKPNWKIIQNRFKTFRKDVKFECLSIPLQAEKASKDKAAQILQWWHGIEQRSIQLAMEYEYVLHADITDCYASIYTHSLAWAVHDKSVAKQGKGDKTLLGNILDGRLQDMRHGQTNGIPQGSVLMDFLAEMVLGYADLLLSNRLSTAGITEFHLLRYRDDYRIFVNNPQIGDAILKALTEVLIGLGLKLNTSKTTGSLRVVSSSLKPDKLAWIRSRQWDKNLQKHLLTIHAHGIDYPNAGSLVQALTQYNRRLAAAKKVHNPEVLVSIVVDIAYTSPRTFPVCTAILSRLIPKMPKGKRGEVVKRIHAKFAQLPNVGHVEVWLQRISTFYTKDINFDENICKLVKGDNVELWDSSWISAAALKTAVRPKLIVDKTKQKAAKPVMKPKEVDLFEQERY